MRTLSPLRETKGSFVPIGRLTLPYCTVMEIGFVIVAVAELRTGASVADGKRRVGSGIREITEGVDCAGLSE